MPQRVNRYTTSFGVYQGTFRTGVHTISQLGSTVLRFLHPRIFDRIFSLGNFVSSDSAHRLRGLKQRLADGLVVLTRSLSYLVVSSPVDTMTKATCTYSPSSGARDHTETVASYHLIIGGGVLQCFSLFMLSLCKPQQLYQVSFYSARRTSSDSRHLPTDISRPRNRRGHRFWDDVCPQHCCGIPLFPKTSCPGHGHRSDGRSSWRRCPPSEQSIKFIYYWFQETLYSRLC